MLSFRRATGGPRSTSPTLKAGSVITNSAKGGYERTKKIIPHLLAEVGNRGVGQEIVAVHGRGASRRGLEQPGSPEPYLGFDCTVNSASAPAKTRPEYWAVSAEWTIRKQAIVLHKPSARIMVRFHARDLHLVMGATRGTPVRIRVLIDGSRQWPRTEPTSMHKATAPSRSRGSISSFDNRARFSIERFEIDLLDSGVEAFVFTFG